MQPRLSSRVSPTASSAVRDLLANAARPGMISLAGGLPDASLFPADELAELAAELIGRDGKRLLQYARTEGLDECREVLAERFQLGSPERLLITTGSQQGLDLLCRVLLDPGDVVIVSDPEYVGMLQVLRSHGAKPVAVPADEHGLNAEVLADLLAGGLRPKACYLIPHFQNPSGATIDTRRRKALHDLSTRYGFVVIEDDPYRDLYYGSTTGWQPVDVETDPRYTVRLRTASKSLAPGLRVAAVQAPADIHQAMVIAKQSADLHTATLNQALVASAIKAPWFDAHLDRLRSSYGHKCSVLVDALRTTFGPGVQVVRPAGGMFLWVEFTPDVASHAEPWLAAALDHDVCFVPGSAFAVDTDLGRFVRLSFATASADELGEGVKRLASAAASL